MRKAFVLYLRGKILEKSRESMRAVACFHLPPLTKFFPLWFRRPSSVLHFVMGLTNSNAFLPSRLAD